MPLPAVESTIFEAILARRSVRNYLAQEVNKGTISVLLEAAIRAPTVNNEEPRAFVIVQNRDLLHDLSDRAKPIFTAEARQSGSIGMDDDSFDVFADPEFNMFYDAGTLILICGNTETPFIAADCWLAAENLMLAACAMRLGTCIIGSALPALNTLEMKIHLRIPNEFSVIVPIILGYPNDELAPTARKNPVIFSHITVT